MHFQWFLMNVSLYIRLIVSVDIRPEINKYCRDKDRLISSEENDEYLLVDAEIDTIILLACRFCNDNNDKEPAIWFWQDCHQSKPQKELDLGMENNISYNRIHTTPDFSLVIKNFEAADQGIYRCHGLQGQKEELKLNYRLEPVFSSKDEAHTEKGNLTSWEKYYEINLAPVTMRFAVSQMRSIAEIREAGIILEIVSEWGLWSPCERCVRKRGFKTSRAYCRVKRRLDNTFIKNRTTVITELFSKSPMLPCRSMLLDDQVPEISKATRYLPEFILEEKCRTCVKGRKTKRHKFKYKKRYVLAEGAHFAIVCPESNLETQVVWRKDSLLLKKGTGRSFRKKDPEPRILVDTFATLYLVGVSNNEEGNYTCYVNDVKMLQAKITVVSKSRLLTQAFLRHMGYLGFIFLLTSFCYCAGLIVVCKQKDKFKVKDYKEIEAKEERPAFFGEK